MAIKKTDLYARLWASCDQLRGGMDASQYKDYILTLLFVKFVSDKAKNDPYAMIDVPEGCFFEDFVALKGSKEIGEQIDIKIAAIADANDLVGVITQAHFNDEDKLGKGKEMQDRLSKLIGVFEGLELASNRANDDDLLGDAYEYLMRHFATESGKSKGQFYTPSEVSRVLAQVVGITKDTPQDVTVYDPTCGSGSLLLKASDQSSNSLSLYGQEKDSSTSALAKMNFILHGHESDVHCVVHANTLSSPAFIGENNQLKTFDFVVANPPFSSKNWTDGVSPDNDEYGRFEWGVPPEKNGDFAFLLHIIKSLKSNGKGAVILPHGVLFRGNAEARIRENLLKQGYIKGIIGLPANLFYGTGIPACIILIDKEHRTAARFDDDGKPMAGRDLFMVDASKGFMKDGNKNRLRSQDIHKIVDAFNNQLTLPRYSRRVSFSEIVANDYNLNIPRYIDSSEPEDLHDLTAHLQGGIPDKDLDALHAFWQVFPSLRSSLFEPAREGYSHAKVAASEVKTTILNHPEFAAFASASLQPFSDWANNAQLDEIRQGDIPKELILRWSEDLLQRYAAVPLISKYDVYQILMDYWADTLQDDVYLLTQDGWQAGSVVRELFQILDDKNKPKWPEAHDFEVGTAKAKRRYKADLIPRELVEQRFFSDRIKQRDAARQQLEQAEQTLESLLEEHNNEDDLLAAAKDDAGKPTDKLIKVRLKEPGVDSEEAAALTLCQAAIKAIATAKATLKQAQEALDIATFNQYAELDEDDIKALLVDDKWLATLQRQVEAEIERVTQQLASRVKQLEERYHQPLPQIEQSVEQLSNRVAEHLKAMGLEWTL
ncbi:HsdM family class I SAM-dependent methyltransferase [Parathalassolituus penaei]|uniref:site-specific DNA-methyltransferase (adenine-specific) n=1 Tax=Parathalassolituus penaei TaxID=2997323 RepID=A0A9X3IS57_9GAMM|nr:class I SAM-dependent DNA methyltransferase [Parathalassolituus penaei]MCY0964539.1 class I SAM-dependent DNA methyltransferase [Parathalassolituus penaei]